MELGNLIEGAVKNYRVPKSGKFGLQALMALDPDYKEIIKNAEEYWLTKANTILTEIIDKIREKAQEPGTSMGDLVRALEVISNKYNLHQGKPTSLNVNVVQNMTTKEIDKRIEELQSQFLSPPERCENLLDPPSPLCTSQVSPSGRRIVYEEEDET